MKVHIIAVGRLRGGPEADLISDYLTRFDRTGRALSLGPAQVVEVDDRKGGGMAAEAELLRRAVPKGALLAVMDERGQVESSPKFAERLAGWRDGGRSDLALVIGGVWPHMLVRVMLAEQLYRAASILAGAPYHRD